MKKRRSQIPVVPALVGLGAVGVAAVVLAQTGGNRRGAALATVQANARTASTADATADPAIGARKPLSYYTGGVRSDLFSAPQPAQPKPAPVKVKDEPLPPPVPVADVNPLGDYAYTGTVTMGGRTMALVENSKTKEGQYLNIGDQLVGARLTELGDRLLTFNLEGKTYTLAKSDNFALTPLDKSAAFLTEQPQNQQMSGPGGPGGPGGGRAARFQQMMQNMTPEQRQQMQDRWNNRSFNRGGGGWGGRGGGGWGGGGGFGGGMGFGGGFGGG